MGWVLAQNHETNSLRSMKFISQVFRLHLESEEMASDPKSGKTGSDSRAYAFTMLGEADWVWLRAMATGSE